MVFWNQSHWVFSTQLAIVWIRTTQAASGGWIMEQRQRTAAAATPPQQPPALGLLMTKPELLPFCLIQRSQQSVSQPVTHSFNSFCIYLVTVPSVLTVTIHSRWFVWFKFDCVAHMNVTHNHHLIAANAVEMWRGKRQTNANETIAWQCRIRNEMGKKKPERLTRQRRNYCVEII